MDMENKTLAEDTAKKTAPAEEPKTDDTTNNE